MQRLQFHFHYGIPLKPYSDRMLAKTHIYNDIRIDLVYIAFSVCRV